jgi:ketosteroid isomerase-like protein
LTNGDRVRELYRIGRRGRVEEAAALVAEAATWHSARTRPCETREDVVKTLFWLANAHRLRPREVIEVGDSVVVVLRGAHLRRLGARGLVPRLFQVVTLRAGQVTSIRDYGRREDAFAAAGLGG